VITALFHFWLARKTVVPQFEFLAVVATFLLGFRAWWALRIRTHASQPPIKGGKTDIFNKSNA
jgi:DMSO/TMAO reductase YedYZ heme-binding membrane subunit